MCGIDRAIVDTRIPLQLGFHPLGPLWAPGTPRSLPLQDPPDPPPPACCLAPSSQGSAEVLSTPSVCGPDDLVISSHLSLAASSWTPSLLRCPSRTAPSAASHNGATSAIAPPPAGLVRSHRRGRQRAGRAALATAAAAQERLERRDHVQRLGGGRRAGADPRHRHCDADPRHHRRLLVPPAVAGAGARARGEGLHGVHGHPGHHGALGAGPRGHAVHGDDARQLLPEHDRRVRGL